jgi:hypothetical protein
VISQNVQIISNLQCPTGLCALCVDCVESEWVRVHSAWTMQSQPVHMDFTWIWDVCMDSTQKLHSTEIEPGFQQWNQQQLWDVYFTTIPLACHTLPTYAIYVTCGLIGKHIYFYSIWDIWYMSWTSFSMWIQRQCPFYDQTNHIW